MAAATEEIARDEKLVAFKAASAEKETAFKSLLDLSIKRQSPSGRSCMNFLGQTTEAVEARGTALDVLILYSCSFMGLS